MLKQISLILLVLFPGLNKFCYSQQAEKVAVLWCDPLLNIRKIYSRNGIINILNKVQKSGIEAIALGIKTSSGEVIYDSKIAPRLLEWDDFRVPLNFDPIQTFLTEGRNRHLQIYAVFSVFSEGHMVKRKGPIYNGHPEWQTRVYMVEEEKPSLLPITEWVYGTTAFANPLLSEVQQYEITLIKEFLSTYTVDALILD
ncbi:MAG: family 10 glycosylhydrolase, partial [bacterium]